ncbi:MAG: hypothetical protein AB7Y46_00860 [Armatimonadota bacterium]
MTLRHLLATSLALNAAIAWAQTARFDGVRVNLWPSPRVVPADGKTAATIRAELRDAAGRPVADGTTIVFRAEGASLSLGGDERRPAVTTTTVGGAATVYAIASTPAVATIHAELTSGEGKNHVTVAFVEEGSALLGGAGVVQIRGGWVGYAIDLAVVEARDEAELQFGGVRIIAQDVLQVDVNTLTVRASPGRIEAGERSLEGDQLAYDLTSGEGVLRRLSDEGIEVFCFDCYELVEREPEEEVSPERVRLRAVDAGAWAVAKGVSIYPQEKVVLRDATLYTGTKKVLDLPRYWVIAMPGYTGSSHTGVLGVSSAGDLAVDFPYFYRVTETRSGAIKLQHGAQAGSVIARDDWSLALEEAYDTGTAEGSLSLVGLPRDDWGIQWRDQRKLGPRRDGYFTAYSPDHESWYADANVYQWSGDQRLTLSASIQQPRGERLSYGAGADWLGMNRPLGALNASYRLGTALGLRHVEGYDEGLVAQHQLYGAIDLPRLLIGERSSLTPALSDLFTWDTAGYQHNSLRGELRLRHVFTSDKSLWLSYQGQLTSGSDADGYEHLVNLDLRAYHGDRWASYFSGTYDLTDSELYAYGLVDHYLDDDWRLGLAVTYYNVDDGGYDDYEITVARRIGATEIGLRWSEESGRFSLELGDLVGLGW